MAVRKHYMTLNIRDNTEITHIDNNGRVEVTFEKAVYNGFNTAILLLDGTVLSNNGFNDADIDYFKNFVVKHAEVIGMESRGEI